MKNEIVVRASRLNVQPRRPKEYDLMNKTRKQLKQALIRKQLTS
jgi:hypothetical protein